MGRKESDTTWQLNNKVRTCQAQDQYGPKHRGNWQDVCKEMTLGLFTLLPILGSLLSVVSPHIKEILFQ